MRAESGRASSNVENLLAGCLVEGDLAAHVRARRTRRHALLLSLCFESALLAGLVLSPMLATGEQPLVRRVVIPIPPPRGLLRGQPQASRGHYPSTKTDAQRPPRLSFPVPHLPRPNPAAEGAGTAGAATTGADLGAGVPGGLDSIDRLGFVRIAPEAPKVRPPLEEKRAVLQSEGVQQALLVRRVDPIYPLLAVQIRLEGTVRLRAIIAKDGTVSALEVLSGHPILAHAALEAVERWRYRPTLLNGQPVEVETYITVIFRLRG